MAGSSSRRGFNQLEGFREDWLAGLEKKNKDPI